MRPQNAPLAGYAPDAIVAAAADWLDQVAGCITRDVEHDGIPAAYDTDKVHLILPTHQLPPQAAPVVINYATFFLGGFAAHHVAMHSDHIYTPGTLTDPQQAKATTGFLYNAASRLRTLLNDRQGAPS